MQPRQKYPGIGGRTRDAVFRLCKENKKSVVGVEYELRVAFLARVVKLDSVVSFGKWPKHRIGMPTGLCVRVPARSNAGRIRS